MVGQREVLLRHAPGDCLSEASEVRGAGPGFRNARVGGQGCEARVSECRGEKKVRDKEREEREEREREREREREIPVQRRCQGCRGGRWAPLARPSAVESPA